MIAELETVKMEIERLSNKSKYPFDEPAQLELARVALKHAKNLTHLRDIIAEISEQWDHCPDGRELREALSATKHIPEHIEYKLGKCSVGQCDGSGWMEVRALHSVVRGPNGTAYTEKRPLTLEQAKDLEKKIDWKDQIIYTGAKRCACKSVMTHEAGE